MTVREQFPGLAFGAAVVLSALAVAAAPPPEQNTVSWSDQHRQIAPESGARITGQWVTARAPYLRRPMLVAGIDHPSGSVWMRASAKVGKTQVPLNALLHAVDTAPRSAMVLCPSLGKATDFEREVFTPAANATTKVATKIMATRSRSGEGSTTRHKRFRGGFLKISTASSEKELQQSDIGLLILEEPSSYPADVGGRGSPLRQARARTFAWGDDAKEIGTGTPKFVGDCVVTDEVMARTCERPYMPCPHCGWLQLLVWENMERLEGRPYFVCQAPDCGELIGHEHKLAMLERFDALHPELQGWVPCFRSVDPTNPEKENEANPVPPSCFPPEDLAKWQARDTEGRDPSFDGVWQAHSPFTSWARVFKEWDEAQGDPEKLASFYQQVLGLPFEMAYERPKAKPLYEARLTAAKLAGVETGRIPSWAWALIGTADLQGYGIVWTAWAVGPGPDGVGRRYARIERGIINIPPVDPKAWTELAAITKRTYEGPSCRPIEFDRFGIDTGGHHTSQAYAFCAGRPNVYALKGKPNDREALPLTSGKPVKAKIGNRVVARLPLFLVGTHKLKKDVYFGLAQTLAGVTAGDHLAGSITLDPSAAESDFNELTAEVLLPRDPAKGRREEAWERSPVGAPNEELDLTVYAMALAWAFLPDRMTAADWDELAARRRRDPVRAEELPLETVWSAAPTEASAPQPTKPAEPASPVTPTKNALLALARSNRGD